MNTFFKQNDSEWLYSLYTRGQPLQWIIDKKDDCHRGAIGYFESPFVIYIFNFVVDREYDRDTILAEMLSRLQNVYPYKYLKVQVYLLYKPNAMLIEKCSERIKLYQRHGFRKVSTIGECLTMIRT